MNSNAALEERKQFPTFLSTLLSIRAIFFLKEIYLVLSIDALQIKCTELIFLKKPVRKNSEILPILLCKNVLFFLCYICRVQETTQEQKPDSIYTSFSQITKTPAAALLD